MKRLFLISIVFLSGCLYSFRGYTSFEYESITVMPFYNETMRYGLEDIFYEKTLEGFIRDGRIKILESGGQSILYVDITDYQNQPYTFDENENINDYRIDVSLSLSFKKDNGEGIWEKTIHEWVTYERALTEDNGIQSLAEKISSTIVRTVLE